jgi:hypothetical protein
MFAPASCLRSPASAGMTIPPGAAAEADEASQ